MARSARMNMEYDRHVLRWRCGSLAAGADDLGLIVTALAHITRLKPHFEAMSIMAGLRLQPSKCVLVPLWGILSDTDVAALRVELGTLMEGWGDFRIASFMKYLGVKLGPGATNDMQWAEAAG
eukprot:7656488-Pyramimonas_sp.AAC.1